MFLIVILALVVFLIAFDKFIPKNLYPLAVFAIAIALLYHHSLIFMYITGWDIHLEYYLANLVKMKFIWDPTIFSSVNAMLSIVMLVPIFSDICGMSLTWVFKIIYPLIFALVPLGLYRVFQKQTNNKIAFLACFFFVSVFTFYTEMLALARQQIAELFFVLLMLVMINKNIGGMKRSSLFIVFGISLIVSHYGTSYIYMFSLILTWMISVLIDDPALQSLGVNFHAKFGRYTNKKFACNQISLNMRNGTIKSTFVLLFIVFTLAWYMYVSSAHVFDVAVRIGDQIINSITTEFLNPNAAQGMGTMMSYAGSPLREVTKYFHLITLFFIMVGILALLLKRTEMKFEKEYIIFSYVYFLICMMGVAVPHFASSLNATRLYHFSLLFLAPFCIIGGITFFRTACSVVRVSWTNKHLNSSLNVLSVFLAIFLLFNTQFIFQVAGDSPTSLSLSQGWVKEYGNARDRNSFYGEYHPEQDIFGVKWLSKNRNNKVRLYADLSHVTHSFVSYGMMPYQYILTNTTIVIKDSYVYMGYANVRYGLVYGAPEKKECWWNITELSPSLNEMNMIYSNGGAQVYYR